MKTTDMKTTDKCRCITLLNNMPHKNIPFNVTHARICLFNRYSTKHGIIVYLSINTNINKNSQ